MAQRAQWRGIFVYEYKGCDYDDDGMRTRAMGNLVSRRRFLATTFGAAVVLKRGSRLLAQAAFDTGESWTTEERLLPAVPITRGPRQHFFGYYDKQQFDAANRRLLGLECDAVGRLQRTEDVATVGIVDIERDNQWTPLVETRAWNWQMGCHAEWLPGNQLRIIYNDRRERQLVAVIRDLDKKGEVVLPRPIFTVAPDGRWGVSLNFARLWRYRPETGFCGVDDPWYGQATPGGDGLFRVDFATGKSTLIVSHKDMAAFRSPDTEGGIWYFTHPSINEDGNRLLFWYRMAVQKGFSRSGVYTANPHGGDIHLVATGNSHTVWQGRENILAWLGKGPRGARFYLCRDKSDEMRVVGGKALNANGHALYSPDGKWLLTDRPLNRSNERTLVIADLTHRHCHDIGRFAEMRELKGPLRCDLHARWNRDGTAICFESTHEQSRQMYLVNVSRLVRPA